MSAYLADILRTFKNYKALGDGALAQVSDADLHTLIDPDANSIAIIVKHVAGNLRSRFTRLPHQPTGKNRTAIATASSRCRTAHRAIRSWRCGTKDGTWR